MYKRITQAANTSIMDLQTFFDAMEDLSNIIFPGQLGKLDALIDLVLENINDIKPTKASAAQPNKGYMATTKNMKLEKSKNRS